MEKQLERQAVANGVEHRTLSSQALQKALIPLQDVTVFVAVGADEAYRAFISLGVPASQIHRTLPPLQKAPQKQKLFYVKVGIDAALRCAGEDGGSSTKADDVSSAFARFFGGGLVDDAWIKASTSVVEIGGGVIKPLLGFKPAILLQLEIASRESDWASLFNEVYRVPECRWLERKQRQDIRDERGRKAVVILDSPEDVESSVRVKASYLEKIKKAKKAKDNAMTEKYKSKLRRYRGDSMTLPDFLQFVSVFE